jgi:DNA-binding HxlR family transcriptional regulator
VVAVVTLPVAAQEWSGSVGAGYVWQDVSGSEDSFRSQLNLQDGFVLEEFDLRYRGDSGLREFTIDLHHATKGPVYGLWLLEELAALGHRVSPGTLYPQLARTEAHGWLRSSSTKGPKDRRDYRITPAGRRLLNSLRDDVTDLYRELVLGEEPERPRPGPS